MYEGYAQIIQRTINFGSPYIQSLAVFPDAHLEIHLYVDMF
jgi:hypothetical protein